MHITVVLAVGFDSWQLTSQGSKLRSAGFVVISASSIRDAMEQFKVGDFDLVLLGRSISGEHRERLTNLIRNAGTHTPVVSIPTSSCDGNSFADETLQNNAGALLTGMEELLAMTPRARALPALLWGNAADGAAHR